MSVQVQKLECNTHFMHSMLHSQSIATTFAFKT